ncbi:phosphoserine transaminase [Canibacter sp. lx-45]|uniref:aminotransferase class V-fold PLP-dependent enzyme n=1 Tax=Canibacter zhuwentaonis TaxID=2837491 RepID=UPI001BDDB09B|nr:aminotransferase class V-fold PLP-dependent enzyme [Canibacter zhuwentaonis]MBT1035741.1 phosphoserine transaminase [Canibacter zhuwentaonis]
MTAIKIPRELLPADGRFGCGPSKIRPAQLEFLASLQPQVLGTSHRQSPVKNLVASVQEQLLELFAAPEGYEIILGNGGAAVFWDSAVHSLIRNRSQHASFGEFGAKFASAARNAPFLADPQIITAEPGQYAACRTANATIDVYAYPHNETSTGVMSDVKRYGTDVTTEADRTRNANSAGSASGAAGASDALTVVDATSAAGGLAFDASEVDVYYFSPQKNFASDGGLWFALVSPAAVARIAEVASSGRYIPETLSLQVALENSRKNQTLNTPSVATLALMDEQLRWIIRSGGMKFADSRTQESANILYAWAAEHSKITPFVADVAHRSQVVVTLDVAPEINAALVSKALRENGIVDTESYRKLGRNQLRIATFTAIDPADVRKLTACIDTVLNSLAA